LSFAGEDALPERNSADHSPLLELRILVGYLGEKLQHAWWPTEFFAPHALQFLAPSFPRTVRLAQYNGVREAARLLHDEHIGVGRVFHLFRFPAEVEQDLHRAAAELKEESALIANIGSRDAAMIRLREIANGSTTTGEGPVSIASQEQFRSKKSLSTLAAHYARAFDGELRVYPYFTA
jgi:hypothetical protein